ncbi:hypothetical protein [Xylophilus sp. GOD-11R]|uniref:hypothetical protein n=1 Tax=Xylophilus sp. GOD-11R TaxID=3089814 RepID=UPI00298CB60C|nr:hypothetical protein [Xylophilus sp. GOD-11R]WPB56218.1 hypothetical protein R9X41_19045 [Xylophilus sp. GOD-11R]
MAVIHDGDSGPIGGKPSGQGEKDQSLNEDDVRPPFGDADEMGYVMGRMVG